MNQEAAELNIASSRMDATWVERLKGIALNHSDSDSDEPQIVVVKLPDVRELSESQIKERVSAVIGGDSPTHVVADLAEPPDRWQGSPGTGPDRSSDADDSDADDKAPKDPQTPAANVTADATDPVVDLQNVDSESIETLVNAITERFPPSVPGILMFSGSEDNPHCEETCAQVALALAKQTKGRVLLIDSDFECAKLSNAATGDFETGLTTYLSRDVQWKDMIARRSAIGLDFMPMGPGKVKYWSSARQKVLPLVREFKENYQYVCISVGDAHQKSASLWAEVADGTYLIVSLEYSSQTVALSASEYLKSLGARVMGCIVTESS